MTGAHFSSEEELSNLIDNYFNQFNDEPETQNNHENALKAKEGKPSKKRNASDSPTLTGLILYTGFNSKQEFDDYEIEGAFSDALKRGRLRVEEVYEKKLSQSSPTGAIFVLKCLGWSDKPDNKPGTNDNKNMTMEVVITGPPLATSEKEIVIQ